MKIFICFTFLLIAFNLQAEFLPQSFSAKFSQEYVSSINGKSKKGNGVIEYKYPSNVRFETTSPSPILFISNGKKSWYYRAPFIDGEEGELTETNAKDSNNVMSKFFDSLKNGLASNPQYTVDKINNSIFELKFSKKTSKDLGIKSAVINFNDLNTMKFQEIKFVDLIFLDGKKSTLNFSDIKVNIPLEEKRFFFEKPKKN